MRALPWCRGGGDVMWLWLYLDRVRMQGVGLGLMAKEKERKRASREVYEFRLQTSYREGERKLQISSRASLYTCLSRCRFKVIWM